MLNEVLLFIHAAELLLFGVFLSASFSNIKLNRKNISVFLIFSLLSGIIQLLIYIFFSEEIVWKMYPFISHFPLIILLILGYKKKIATAIVSISTAYLCCQPAKWFGIMAKTASNKSEVEYIIQILTLIFVFMIIYFRFSAYLAEIFEKDVKSVYIFGITPIVYYVFDYISAIYTDFWKAKIHEAAEFLALFVCVIFLVFCIIYYKEYEQKADAQRKEQIVRITVDEQKKELDAVKRNEQTVRIMRHDMRHFLFNLQTCIDNDDKITAKKMISSFVENIDSAVVKTYCGNTTINYIISGFAERCKEEKIKFNCKIEASEFLCDETMFSTIISNALDNAINSQKSLPEKEREIELMLKNHNGKLLLSVKNPIREKPVFINGMPVSDRKGHGYGTQSIVYLTEHMGGNSKFSIEENKFVLRVII